MGKIELSIPDIINIIPHRYPFLLVDRVIIEEETKKAVGIKNVTINEHFFQGHFPGNPIMPGVLIIEAMAQVGAVMALRLPQNEGKIVYFAAIDNIRFRRPVVPGDQLIIDVEVLWVKGPIGKVRASAKVEGSIAAEGEFMFSFVDKSARKGASVDATALVHPTAKLGDGVKIGPFCIIGPEVEIGEGTVLEGHCIVHKWTRIGKDCKIAQSVSIAAPPQDIRYKGEKGAVIIGDRNIIREFVTIHLPQGEGNQTVIGNDNFIMVHAHIPHNAKIGNNVVIGGYVGLAGHVQIDDYVIIGGLCGVHQFCRIGKMAMIGAQSKVVQDVPPFMLVEGNPAQVKKVNSIGLQRRGISQEAQTEIKKAFKIIYGNRISTVQAIEEIRKKTHPLEEIKILIEFLEKATDRGINKRFGGDAEDEMLLPELPEIGL
ncbi:MAG: acyl-ACP--UDP-N-acetylglucosamine O-acyltransferase [Candidatus Saganbacteria bacterium]|nr:acyl-ACP--UDP-N-acetylglucosamine O-acyltransferase [Candidatus Saganbacteria bacterium]